MEQFSKAIEPPADGWIYIGKNVDRNLVETSAFSAKSKTGLVLAHHKGTGAVQKTPEEFELLSDEEVMNNISTQDHVYSDVDMLHGKDDDIRVYSTIVTDDSHASTVEGTKPGRHKTYYVEGCTLQHLNGRYIDRYVTPCPFSFSL